MSSKEIPVVSEAVLSAFLRQVVVYVKENPIVISDYDKESMDLIDKKPFMYVPCQVRKAGLCPDQMMQFPECHKCPSAEASASLLQKIGSQLGIVVDQPDKYPGLGTLVQTMSMDRPNTGMAFEIDGDNQGSVTIFLNDTRAPSTYKKKFV